LEFFTGNIVALVKHMTLNSSGNLGLGVTPSAWGLSGAKAAQVINASFWGYLNNAYVSANNYNDGTGNKYIATGFASRYEQSSGAHVWQTAPSGTADNAISFTQAMTLDASGNLLVGTTTPNYFTSGRGLVEINGSSSALIAIKTGDTARGYFAASSTVTELSAVGASQPLLFTTNGSERARIDSSGNLGLGVTAPADKLEIGGSGAGIILASPNGTRYRITVSNIGVLTVAAV
jgi:hypothetical protein